MHSHWSGALYLRLLELLQTNQVNRSESVLETPMHWPEEWDRVRQAPIGSSAREGRTVTQGPHVSVPDKKETQSGVRGNPEEKSQRWKATGFEPGTFRVSPIR